LLIVTFVCKKYSLISSITYDVPADKFTLFPIVKLVSDAIAVISYQVDISVGLFEPKPILAPTAILSVCQAVPDPVIVVDEPAVDTVQPVVSYT